MTSSMMISHKLLCIQNNVRYNIHLFIHELIASLEYMYVFVLMSRASKKKYSETI